MLSKFCIVLVGTTHSGNLGAVARAMKTMGVAELRLAGIACTIDEQAIAMSAGADDLLNQALIFPDFPSAIADCQLVVGASARLRHLQNTLLPPKECIAHIYNQATTQDSKIALVFGRESSGLNNQELLRCNYHLNIPANPEYSSLNLAMAVQIVTYELRQFWLASQGGMPKTPKIKKTINYPTAQELEYFFQQTQQLYEELGFIQNPSLMAKLIHLYQRANLTQGELNMLNGMLNSVKNALKNS